MFTHDMENSKLCEAVQGRREWSKGAKLQLLGLLMTWKTLSYVKLCKEEETMEQVSKIANIGGARFEAVDNCGVF